jgi:hypothetical protein
MLIAFALLCISCFLLLLSVISFFLTFECYAQAHRAKNQALLLGPDHCGFESWYGNARERFQSFLYAKMITQRLLILFMSTCIASGSIMIDEQDTGVILVLWIIICIFEIHRLNQPTREEEGIDDEQATQQDADPDSYNPIIDKF